MTRITDEALAEYLKQEPLYGHDSADLVLFLKAEREYCRELEAENATLKDTVEKHTRKTQDFVEGYQRACARAEAAEARLLAVEGLPRYLPTFREGTAMREFKSMDEDELGVWVYVPELEAALKGEQP